MKELRLGTRGSPLALKQANMVRDALLKVQPDMHVEIVTILTSGDWKPADGETRLSEEEGGKGLFAKEIQHRLLQGEIDIAVHSMKDMESHEIEDLIIPWMLPREDPRDAIVCNDLSNNSQKLQDLPDGCVVATSSTRRAAFVLHERPDIKIKPIRGNVQTRLDKLKNGMADATMLAVAGLKRLGLENEISFILDTGDMLPSAGQGAVGIEIRKDDLNKLFFIGQISCSNTVLCVKGEREALRILDGSCHTPIGAYATLENDEMHLRVAVCSQDGKQYFEETVQATITDVDEVYALGSKVGESLKGQLPEGFLE